MPLTTEQLVNLSPDRPNHDADLHRRFNRARRRAARGQPAHTLASIRRLALMLAECFAKFQSAHADRTDHKNGEYVLSSCGCSLCHYVNEFTEEPVREDLNAHLTFARLALEHLAAIIDNALPIGTE
jgi:hypothetical protein